LALHLRDNTDEKHAPVIYSPKSRKTRMDRVAARCPESGEHADEQSCHDGHFGSVQYRL